MVAINKYLAFCIAQLLVTDVVAEDSSTVTYDRNSTLVLADYALPFISATDANNTETGRRSSTLPLVRYRPTRAHGDGTLDACREQQEVSDRWVFAPPYPPVPPSGLDRPPVAVVFSAAYCDLTTAVQNVINLEVSKNVSVIFALQVGGIEGSLLSSNQIEGDTPARYSFDPAQVVTREGKQIAVHRVFGSNAEALLRDVLKCERKPVAVEARIINRGWDWSCEVPNKENVLKANNFTIPISGGNESTEPPTQLVNSTELPTQFTNTTQPPTQQVNVTDPGYSNFTEAINSTNTNSTDSSNTTSLTNHKLETYRDWRPLITVVSSPSPWHIRFQGVEWIMYTAVGILAFLYIGVHCIQAIWYLAKKNSQRSAGTQTLQASTLKWLLLVSCLKITYFILLFLEDSFEIWMPQMARQLVLVLGYSTALVSMLILLLYFMQLVHNIGRQLSNLSHGKLVAVNIFGVVLFVLETVLTVLHALRVNGTRLLEAISLGTLCILGLLVSLGMLFYGLKISRRLTGAPRPTVIRPTSKVTRTSHKVEADENHSGSTTTTKSNSTGTTLTQKLSSKNSRRLIGRPSITVSKLRKYRMERLKPLTRLVTVCAGVMFLINGLQVGAIFLPHLYTPSWYIAMFWILLVAEFSFIFILMVTISPLTKKQSVKPVRPLASMPKYGKEVDLEANRPNNPQNLSRPKLEFIAKPEEENEEDDDVLAFPQFKPLGSFVVSSQTRESVKRILGSTLNLSSSSFRNLIPARRSDESASITSDSSRHTRTSRVSRVGGGSVVVDAPKIEMTHEGYRSLSRSEQSQFLD